MQTDPNGDKTATRVAPRTHVQAAYTVSLAQSPAEVRAAQNLRFLVFNVEMNEGLEQSFATCLDADPFDDICDHLIVKEIQTGDELQFESYMNTNYFGDQDNQRLCANFMQKRNQ